MAMIKPSKKKRKTPSSTLNSTPEVARSSGGRCVTNETDQEFHAPRWNQDPSPAARRNLLPDLNAASVSPNAESSFFVTQMQSQNIDDSTRQALTLTCGWCMDRSMGIKCYCCVAKYAQQCKACGGRINLGDCAHGMGIHGWMHTRCENDQNRDNCDALFKGFLPLSPSGRLTWESPIKESRNSPRKLLTDAPSIAAVPPSTLKSKNNNICSVIHTYEREYKRSAEDGFGPTEEQYAILEHKPNRGDLIRVKARAGTGKTTTVALLCHELLRKDPRLKILYIIFAANGSMSAKKSGKFPKYMSIMTSHSFALQSLQMRRFNNFKDGYNKKTVMTRLGLENWVQHTFGLLGSLQKLRRRCMTIAGYIIKTLEKFQQSDDARVNLYHVYWKANVIGVSEKLEWRSKVSRDQYVSWAQAIFDPVYQFCSEYSSHPRGSNPRMPDNVDITHDGYFKTCQLQRIFSQGSVGPQYDVFIVDESQDMNACQASVMWGSTRKKNNNPTVYIVGDDRQRLYRFRGASQYFEASSATKEFQLTGSFRFGETIGKLATLVLQQKQHSEDNVQGLARQEGEICFSTEFQTGAVICRFNNGIYQFLQEARPPKWALYSQNTAASPRVYYEELNKLLSFMVGQIKTYLCEGEVFRSFSELEEFCTETDNTDMLNKIAMVKSFQENATNMPDLFAGLHDSFVSDWRTHCSSIDEFDGVVLLTCHKAKGLEFNNVLVYDDFRFDDIIKLERENLLANEYAREMIDLVYVAFTPTKERLFLCPGGMSYVEWLEDQRQRDENRSNSLIADTTLAELRDDMDLNWALFVDETTPIKLIDDVPWPLGKDDNPFCFEPSMSLAQQVKGWKVVLLRYHPDKFFQVFRKRLELDDEEAFKNKLNEITARAAALRRDLRPLEEA